MTNRKKVNDILCRIKCVDNSIIANAQTVTVTPGQMVVREGIQTKSHFVDFRFNSIANSLRKPEECSIEASVKDLLCCAHANSGFARPRAKACEHLALRFANIAFAF